MKYLFTFAALPLFFPISADQIRKYVDSSLLLTLNSLSLSLSTNNIANYSIIKLILHLLFIIPLSRAICGVCVSLFLMKFSFYFSGVFVLHLHFHRKENFTQIHHRVSPSALLTVCTWSFSVSIFKLKKKTIKKMRQNQFHPEEVKLMC